MAPAASAQRAARRRCALRVCAWQQLRMTDHGEAIRIISARRASRRERSAYAGDD